MDSIIKRINNAFVKTVFLSCVFVLTFLAADQALAGTPQLRVKNTTPGHEAYSAGSAFASSVRAEPGDTLEWQMFANFTSAAGITIVLPSDLTYAATTYSNPAATASANGQTITWTFASGSTEVIRFTTTVASGAALSATHTHNLTFTTDTAVTSDTATVQTGPIIKTITPSSGGDATAVNLTLTGHGFTQISDITSITLSDSTNILQSLAVSGPDGQGLYTITGVRVPAGKTVGTYYIIFTTTVSGTALSTEASTSETVAYTVADSTSPTLSSAPSYVHSSGVLTLTFNETIDVSATDLSKITLYDASSGGNSQVLTGATKSETDATTITFTLTQSQRNTVSAWGQSTANLYVQIAGNGIYDLSNNALVAQDSRTAVTSWTKDTTQPTAAITYTQNSATTTSVKAGDVTITATFSEPMVATPKVAIDQPGGTDIAATNMSLPAGGNGTIWIYTYTINAASDGTAAVTLSSAVDYANNALNTTTGTSFVIDYLGPSPAITNLSGGAAGQTAATFSWTPTYTGSDFSTYKFYHSASTGVTSANGTEINKNSSGYSSLGTASTNSLTLSGLFAATRYFAVIYICDAANNCSAPSNEAEAQTDSQAVIYIPPSGGGGGSSSAPSTASSAGTITSSGGAITTTLTSGSSATVIMPANTIESGTLAVSEATTSEKQTAPITASDGVIVGNTVFNIQLAGSASATFSNPVTLEFTYDLGQLGAIDPNTLRIAYFNTATNQWVALASTINPTTHKIQAQTTHFTLFAIVSFAASTTEQTTTPPTNEPGQVLGSSVGVYPNGTLLKAPDSSAVWYIANDQKHVITSAAVFNTRFNWADIVYLPSERQIDLYEQGDSVLFAMGTLVKEEGKSAVYRISATSGKQPILSAGIFLGRGYGWNDVIEVEAGSLSNYQTETYISDKNNFYTGDLVNVAGGTANYYIESAAARRIPSSDIFFSRGFKSQRVRSITAAQFKQFSSGSDLGYPDGTLLKGSKSAVYVISNGKKYAFYSGADLDALFYNRKRIKRVADSVLAGFENASPIRLVQKDIHTAGN